MFFNSLHNFNIEKTYCQMRVVLDSCFSFYVWLNLSQSPVLENFVHFSLMFDTNYE